MPTNPVSYTHLDVYKRQGYTLDELRNDITRETPACFEPTIDYVVTKVPRFTFEKFRCV